MDLYILGRVNKGQLEFDSKKDLSIFMQNNEGKRFVLKEYPRKRTLSQNAFYHFYLTVISRETGDDQNSLHEYFKRMFIPPQVISVLGKEVKIPGSTTRLSKAEFGEYLDRICHLTDVPIPNPEEVKNYLL